MKYDLTTHPSPRMPRPKLASVSVVIVVWNAKKYVIECLQSLDEFCKNVCAEVIVRR